MPEFQTSKKFSITINGQLYERELDVRTLLVEFLREELLLTGTHVGCDTTQCGACTVHFNGEAVKSCTLLLAQADGGRVTTIEGMANGEALHPVQQSFHDHHGLQCGFCTPGMVMIAADILRREQNPSEEVIRHNLEGNICRCTGYHNIVKAISSAASSRPAT